MARYYWTPSILILIFVLAMRYGMFAPSEASMPRAANSQEEQTLYTTIKGRYTQADIDANGGKTATQKYRRFQARHDFNPQSGDRLCPITRTKANPACTWVVDGHNYQFCCPPCIDEFVRQARQSSEPLPVPGDFIKK